MDIRKLQRAIVDGLEDVKAHDIVVFNTEHLSPLFERVIIASGTSNRQTRALAASVRDSVKSRGMQVMRTEGEDNGEWIIVDCGAAVAHIMQPAIRTYYHLEEIWGDKPVRMKMDGGGRPASSMLTPMKPMRAADDEAQRAIAKRPEAGRPPVAKTVAKTAPSKKRPAAAKPGAKASRSKAPARAAVSRTTGTKTPARKAPAKKAPAKKAAATGRR
jgi:ribosome-associated protein